MHENLIRLKAVCEAHKGLKHELVLEIQPVYEHIDKVWFSRANEQPYQETKYSYSWINESPRLNL
jgi:hypothetical protein